MIVYLIYDLAHEYRHKYQYEVVINKTIIPKPFENYTNWEKVLLREVEYIDGSNNYNLYLLQDNEFDANAFAEAVCAIAFRILFQSLKQKYHNTIIYQLKPVINLLNT